MVSKKKPTSTSTYGPSPTEKPIVKKSTKKPVSTYGPSPIEKPVNVKKMPVKAPIVKKTPVAAVPAAVDPNQYLTNDTTYQSQLAAINKALGDYQANEQSAEGNYNASYAQNQYDLGRGNTQDTENQTNDYASRGLLRSGLFGKAYGNTQEDYASKQSALDQGRQSYIGGLQRDMSNYISSQTLAQQQARQDAINRRTLSLLTPTPTA